MKAKTMASYTEYYVSRSNKVVALIIKQNGSYLVRSQVLVDSSFLDGKMAKSKRKSGSSTDASRWETELAQAHFAEVFL